MAACTARLVSARDTGWRRGSHGVLSLYWQGFDDVVTSHDNQGDGFAVINNTVQYNRGRGCAPVLAPPAMCENLDAPNQGQACVQQGFQGCRSCLSTFLLRLAPLNTVHLHCKDQALLGELVAGLWHRV